MFRIAALAASLLLFAPAASAEILVFKSGQSMSVRSYRVSGDLATAVLRAGGEVTFPAAMITRVDPDEVPYPVPVDALPVEDAPAVPAAAAPVGVPDAVLAARPFADLISAVAATHQVDARLIHAVIEQESNYQTRARSKKGARGLMQLMPATARQYGVHNSYDPKANIEAGVRHLKDLLSRLELPTALAAYNAGEGTIRRYGGLPPFPETQNYVRRILQRAGHRLGTD
ncbi:MAG: lytic transglycosylase domain-containing protein [Acidobacteriota bacterium]|nr:lytic transglycosylase domain-containing protein [Acidobacteriota bacterium]